MGIPGSSKPVPIPKWGDVKKEWDNYYKKNQGVIDTTAVMLPYVGALVSGRDTRDAARRYGRAVNNREWKKAGGAYASMAGNALMTAADFVGLGSLARGGVRGSRYGIQALKNTPKTLDRLRRLRGLRRFLKPPKPQQSTAVVNNLRKMIPQGARISAKHADEFYDAVKANKKVLGPQYTKLLDEAQYLQGAAGKIRAPFRGFYPSAFGYLDNAALKIPGVRQVAKRLPDSPLSYGQMQGLGFLGMMGGELGYGSGLPDAPQGGLSPMGAAQRAAKEYEAQQYYNNILNPNYINF